MSGKKDTPETAQERAFAEVAQKRFADYKTRWLPLQRKLAEDVQAMGEPGSAQRQQAAGKAATDSSIRFGENKAGVESALGGSAGTVNSSKAKLGITGYGADEAQSRGLSLVASDQAIDDAYLEGLGMITQMGKGEAGGAMKGMQQVAAMSGKQASADAEAAAAHRAGNAKLVGQAAGFGLQGGYNKAINGIQAQFADPTQIPMQPGGGY